MQLACNRVMQLVSDLRKSGLVERELGKGVRVE
jgi:hypothetical protein